MTTMTEQVLSRSVPFELRADDAGDGLTLDGYGAVFGTPTRIDSWEGTFDEEIARGAFKKSISERTPVLQFDHGRHPMVGSIPLGAFEELSEDDHGLHVVARLHDNWMVQPVRDAIASKAIPGMSFRFQVVKDVWRTAGGAVIPAGSLDAHLSRVDPADETTIPKRSIREVRLFEVGPVVFPAYPETTVGVRSQELAALLTDSQVRADLARILVGTPAAPSESEGDSGGERAASTYDEPPAALVTRSIPSKEARNRALMLMKAGITNG